MRSAWWFRIAAALSVLAAGAGGAEGQLLSPGPLSAPHAELQGVRQCTSCHQLGQRGVGADRCLSCHQVLSARLRDSAGYHAAVRDRGCGACHAEHYGREFVLVRLDTSAFDHRDAGYVLKGAHTEVRCSGCHRPEHVRSEALRKEKKTRAALERTFLGLTTSCRGCHESDDVHGRQFSGEDCASCHGETRWAEAPAFDHSRSRYPLTGSHRAAACSGCHPTRAAVTQYRGLAFGSCASCHADPHRGVQGAQCATCHTTGGWRAFSAGFDVSRFDHGRTGFALRGAHGDIDCGACHRTPARNDARIRIRLLRSDSRFAPIAVTDCRSCHVSAHPGARADAGAGAVCSACHDERAWSPAAFGSREHAATRFPLDGAHILLDCRRCHAAPAPGRLEFRQPDIACGACHAQDSPHGGAYADGRGVTTCSRCHVTRSWQPQDVAHEAFPLTGQHAQVACAACHTAERRGSTPRECESCHAAADPHGGRSAGRPCSACHTADSFGDVIRFDHGTTQFVLEGAHAAVPCRACHPPESAARPLVLRYVPVPARCEDCHGT